MNTVVTLDPTVLQLIVAILLPALVALITHKLASSVVKTVALIALSILAGWLTQLQAYGGTFVLGQTLVSIAMTFAGAVVSHFGLLKPLNVTGSEGAIQNTLPGGFGNPDNA